LKFSPMAIPAMALQQQHDARRDIVIEPAARRRAAIEARGHSEPHVTHMLPSSQPRRPAEPCRVAGHILGLSGRVFQGPTGS